MKPPEPVVENIPLAGMTSLEVGGPARFFAEIEDHATLVRLLAWAREQVVATLVIGGGSNLLVADRGFDGLVLRLAERGADSGVVAGEHGLVVDAAVNWDALVALCVERGLAGVECLSGIPGRVGAAPIQNIGAYGQQIASCLHGVRVIDRATGDTAWLAAESCGFRYRSSHFRAHWKERFVITGIELTPTPEGVPTASYPELARRLGNPTHAPTLAVVREQVLAIRGEKSMLLVADDPNRRSAGSFFLNPMVPKATADEVGARSGEPASMPRYPGEGGRVKLSAAWLIERAGFERGYGNGPAGLSTQHTLAIVNRGGATAADILTLADEVRSGVRRSFGIELDQEPVKVGFDPQ